MENHPIPQDVTGFQFKLIGNMTVKQFAYLAIGIVFAWILYQLPVNILIKLPFCAFSAIAGTMLAYLPISGRPIDVMIGNYIKALIRPTQFIYEKTGGHIYIPSKAPATIAKSVKQYKNDFSPFPKDKLKAYLETLDTKSKNKVDERENDFLMSVSNLATNSPAYQEPQPKLVSYSDLPQEPKKITPVQPAQKTEPISHPIPPPAKTLITPIKAPNRMASAPSVPEFPNLITGITKDPRGNALSNILVEVIDKDGNPVRAFKTNEFGKFASATPLVNGTYTINFEDPKSQNRFEKVVVNISGQIISPIEATSIDTREELRRSLFNN